MIVSFTCWGGIKGSGWGISWRDAMTTKMLLEMTHNPFSDFFLSVFLHTQHCASMKTD